MLEETGEPRVQGGIAGELRLETVAERLHPGHVQLVALEHRRFSGGVGEQLRLEARVLFEAEAAQGGFHAR